MSFTTQVANKQYQPNLVVEIGGKFYSSHQVDSDTTDIIGTGVGIEANKVGTISSANINPLTVDIRNVRSTSQTLNFSLVDVGEQITIDLFADTNLFLDTEVVFYVGFVNTTPAFDFASYKVVSRTTPKNISRENSTYRFTSTEVVDLMRDSIFTTQSVLDGAITDSATSLFLIDASDFPASGAITINSEFMLYSGKTGNELTGLSRGDLSSTAAAHDDNDEVFLVTDTGQVNPITLMLQIIISPGGGGTYDVLSDGLGISQSLVDITQFELIRTNNFAGELFQFNLYNIGTGLDFLENELCLATNTRFIPVDGKISLAILDQVDLTATVPIIDESSIVGTPQWKISSDKVVTDIEFRYNFIHGTQKFTRLFTDQDAIAAAAFPSKTLKYEFKGIQAALGGAAIAADRAARLLSRLSTARAEIDVQTHFDKFEINVGDKIQLQHRFIPSGGTLGINEQLEVISKQVDFARGVLRFKLQFTSFSTNRIGLIAPTNFIKAITSQSVFDIESGAGVCWQVGDKVRLWDSVLQAYTADAVNEITAISTDTITVQVAWVTTLIVDQHKLKVADYNDVTASQRSRYAFIADGVTESFDDGTKAYEIII